MDVVNTSDVTPLMQADVDLLKHRYQNRLSKVAHKMIEKHGLPTSKEYTDAASELIDTMARMRVKGELSETEFVEYIQAHVAGDEMALTSARNHIYNLVHQRERERSMYGAGYLSQDDETIMMLSQKKRQDPEYVENFFKGVNRLYFPLPVEPSLIEQKVAALFKDHPKGYKIVDWTSGKATDASGKQEYKIGKILSKIDPQLYKEFQHDSSRTATRMLAVISRDPMDIAKASVNRAWTSCAGPGAGLGNFYAFGSIPDLIEAGGMIAYLVSENDPHIQSPFARSFIKPLNKQRGPADLVDKMVDGIKGMFGKAAKVSKLFIVDKNYGLENEAFTKTVCKVIDAHLNKPYARSGPYRLPYKLYYDGTGEALFKKGEVRTSSYNPH